jgi:cell division protein FtsA
MRESTPHYYVGLDVGTSAVRCIIGSLDESGDEPALSVIGHGRADNSGMRKGLVVHVEEVASAINHAISEAERISGVHVRNVTVNINGTHISGQDSKGVIAISAANREITLEDKLRAEDAATVVQIPSNREIIQVFPKNYRVDGHDSVKDPQGMRGVRLEVETQIVTAAIPNLRSLDSAMERAHITPLHHTVSGLAAAEATLSRKQKEAGTLVLDIGAGTTNMAVIEDGEVQHVAVIPMGGIHITNDLAIGLKTDLDIAEKVKVKHAALGDKGKTGRLSVQQGNANHAFDSADIHMVVEARVEEILEFVDKELKSINKSRKLPGGIVLVGGTARVPGIAEFTRDKLQLAARVGKVRELRGIVEDIQDSSFVTSIGLMQLDMLLEAQAPAGHYGEGAAGRLLGGLGSALRKIKG